MEKSNSFKVSRDQQVMRLGRSFLGRSDPSTAVGFSWPPRSYTCSFCKREFRSAQALGGHMNVHRRDRARLRQCSPPWDSLTSPSKPNPNHNYVPNLNMPPPSLASVDSVLFTLPSFLPSMGQSSSSSLFGVGEWRNFMDEGGRIVREETEVMKLSLEGGSLDLELRLGYT